MSAIRHTGIYVCDLERMKDFYCDHFGMRVAVHAFEKGDYIDTVLALDDVELELYKLCFPDGSMIELIHRKGNERACEQGNVYDVGRAHIAITVDAVNLLAERLLQSNITFLSMPTVSADGRAKVCFCKDPEGNFLELVEELGIDEEL